MAGQPFTAADIQARAGLLVTALSTSLNEVRAFKLWLDDATHNDTALGPGGVGVPTGDLTVIRASFADLGGSTGLYAVARGTHAPSGANNYFFNAKNLSGLTYTA